MYLFNEILEEHVENNANVVNIRHNNVGILIPLVGHMLKFTKCLECSPINVDFW